MRNGQILESDLRLDHGAPESIMRAQDLVNVICDPDHRIGALEPLAECAIEAESEPIEFA